MIVYFTGTGNSKYIAEYLADQLADQVFDAAKQIKNRKHATLHSEKPWIFVGPTYGWQMPHLFMYFIQKSEFAGNQKAYFVMTCGSDIADAGASIGRLCAHKGLEYQGVLPVVMPENYTALFWAPGEKKADRIIERAEKTVAKHLQEIREGRAFLQQEITPMDKMKSTMVNRFFNKNIIKAGPFHATGNCVGCGMCQRVCMLNNISIKEGKPVWGELCTHCMACINSCPEKVIEYGIRTRGKRRYICKSYVKKSEH